MIVDDVWKNYDNYALQKKVLEQSHASIASSQLNKTSLHNTSRKQLNSSSLNRDFIEPNAKLEIKDKNNMSKVYENEYAIDDSSD